jgi:hypothetical protein
MGRLADDQAFKGHGLGGALLADALKFIPPPTSRIHSSTAIAPARQYCAIAVIWETKWSRCPALLTRQYTTVSRVSGAPPSIARASDSSKYRCPEGSRFAVSTPSRSQRLIVPGDLPMRFANSLIRYILLIMVQNRQL